MKTTKLNMTEGAEQWAKEQTNGTLKEWADKMKASNQQKANWSRATKEKMSAAQLELRSRN